MSSKDRSSKICLVFHRLNSATLVVDSETCLDAYWGPSADAAPGKRHLALLRYWALWFP